MMTMAIDNDDNGCGDVDTDDDDDNDDDHGGDYDALRAASHGRHEAA